LGRFFSKDPIGFKGSRWNLYEFVSGNPLVNRDPLGLKDDSTFEDGKGDSEIVEFTCGDKDKDGFAQKFKIGLKGCTAGKKEKIKNRICEAYKGSKKGVDRLAGLNRNSPIIRKWFGEVSLKQFEKIKAVFEKVVKQLEKRSVAKLAYLRVSCRCDCPDGAFAYHVQGGIPKVKTVPVANSIRVCSDFWDKLSDPEQIGVFFHEFTHLYSGTKDLGYWYDPPGEYSLGGETLELTPDDRIRNADTYEHFIQELMGW